MYNQKSTNVLPQQNTCFVVLHLVEYTVYLPLDFERLKKYDSPYRTIFILQWILHLTVLSEIHSFVNFLCS